MSEQKEYNFFNNTLTVFKGLFLYDESESLYFEGTPTKWHNSGLRINDKNNRLNFNEYTHFNFSIKLYSDILYDPTFYLRYWPSKYSNFLNLSSYCNLSDLYQEQYVNISIPLQDFYNGNDYDLMKTEDFIFLSSPIEYNFHINSISLYNENYIEELMGPKLNINLTELNFGTISNNQTMEVSFELINAGDQPLENINITLPESYSVSENNFSINPEENKILKVLFQSDTIQALDPLFEDLFQMLEIAKYDNEMKLKLKEQLKMLIDKI